MYNVQPIITSNQSIIYNFCAYIQGTGSQSVVTVDSALEYKLTLIFTFNKKLSCREEVARCSVSLKILLSLKVTQCHSNLHC